MLDVLGSYELGSAETWNFGDAGVDRLRHAIDPRWYGEMPRSYLYDASGRRIGISGALTPDLLQDWLVSPRARQTLRRNLLNSDGDRPVDRRN